MVLFNRVTMSGRGADWLARLLGVQEDGGSNPLVPTIEDRPHHPKSIEATRPRRVAFFMRKRAQPHGTARRCGGTAVQVGCTTDDGREAILKVLPDQNGTPQIYLFLDDGSPGKGHGQLCHGWGVRKTKSGLKEGVLVSGGVVGIPRKAWMQALHEREDLRDRQNLPHLHLVRVYSRGEKLTLDGYALSARVDKATWKKIAPFMEEVDSTVNDEILEGDHFIGWMVKPGLERKVEKILGVRQEKTLETRNLLPAPVVKRSPS